MNSHGSDNAVAVLIAEILSKDERCKTLSR